MGIFLLTCVAVGIFVFGRRHHTAPIRYRSTVTVRVAEKPPSPDLSSAQARRLATTSTTTPLNIALVGPEKFALRRLPIRRDFYPSPNPSIEARHAEHLKHAEDNLADPNIDAYTLAKAFVYYPRWTGSHFSFHRDLIRVMCLDAGDELKAAWSAINHTTDQERRARALDQLGQLPDVAVTNRATKSKEPVTITWRTAPEISKKYDKLEYTREWTIYFRESYRKAKDLAQ